MLKIDFIGRGMPDLADIISADSYSKSETNEPQEFLKLLRKLLSAEVWDSLNILNTCLVC